MIGSRMIKLCSSEGNLLLRVAQISDICQDPSHMDTCNVRMANGKVYEVSGNLNDIEKKIKEA